jgi:two-component sensor histidine kinase
VAVLERIVSERTDLGPADVDVLSRLVSDWSLLSDLSLSDLVLWVPTWNEAGLVAVAHVRPTTAPTCVPDDVLGTFSPRGRAPHLDLAAALGRPVIRREPERGSVPLGVEAYPIRCQDRVVGVVSREASAAPRVAGQLERIYLDSADELFAMLVEGTFPTPGGDGQDRSPRVGDGVMRLDPTGRVTYASPNSVSALRRLGLATDVVGSSFPELVTRLTHRPGPVDASVSAVASGRVAGSADVENASATVLLRGIPLVRSGQHLGAIVFCQDVTDLRRRERALVSKDATIREIHHRVKNNLQTVAAMLRLQARRAGTAEAKEALGEAELRVAAIAVVHESLTTDVGEQVDFDAIVDRIIGLVGDLAPAYSAGREVPWLARSGSLGLLSADLATPLAMSVSELLYNAVEHAAATRIEVMLSRSADANGLRLVVRDDGVGLPDGFDVAKGGLGTSIVTSLVTGDLQGECRFERAEPGTEVTIEVPLRG